LSVMTIKILLQKRKYNKIMESPKCHLSSTTHSSMISTKRVHRRVRAQTRIARATLRLISMDVPMARLSRKVVQHKAICSIRKCSQRHIDGHANVVEVAGNRKLKLVSRRPLGLMPQDLCLTLPCHIRLSGAQCTAMVANIWCRGPLEVVVQPMHEVLTQINAPPSRDLTCVQPILLGRVRSVSVNRWLCRAQRMAAGLVRTACRSTTK
jgi:hypothetical protein